MEFTPNIFERLKTALIARLESDAFFSDPETEIVVIDDASPTYFEEKDNALSTKGLAVVAEVRQVVASPLGVRHGGVVVRLVFSAHEVIFLNREDGGTGKTAQDVLVKCLSLFASPWTPDEDVWSYLLFSRFELVRTDEERIEKTWEIEFTTSTFLETVVQVLATEDGNPLVTEDGLYLQVSPTSA